MILLREIQEGDLAALERFAKIPGFINLPDDREMLSSQVQRSMRSFRGELKSKWEGKYMFVAEDVSSGRVVATSMIAAQHGTEKAPHFYFQVGSEQKFSKTINTGFIHGTLELKYETNGPSEIGGIVVDPASRNSPEHIGRQVAFVRFMFLGRNRKLFKDRIIAELLPPLNKQGLSPLWEAVGRRFTNMEYWEADRLCQKNKEFIFSLFPTGKIYTTFLPAEARDAIGKVGSQTEPAFHMLTKIGFKYMDQVDPFDGGPHLWTNSEELTPVRKLTLGTLCRRNEIRGAETEQGLVCAETQEPGKFRAVTCAALKSDGKVALVDEDAGSRLELIGLAEGDRVVFMPYY